MVQPMLASTVEVPLRGEDLVYEPKYDGVRTLALLTPGRPRPGVRLTSRLGNDKTSQFPEIARELERFAKERLKSPLLLDGEVVALDDRGRPVSFQHLQGRIHVKSPSKVTAAEAPVAFVAFDLLREGGDDLRGLPLTARRARLERVFNDPGSPLLRMSPQVAGDGRDLYRQALADGWEGLDREARQLALLLRQAVQRVEQAEVDPRAGVRGRRMDRTSRRPFAFRRAAARGLRRQEARLRRARWQRVQREGVEQADGAAASATGRREPIRRAHRPTQTTRRTGCVPSSSRK